MADMCGPRSRVQPGERLPRCVSGPVAERGRLGATRGGREKGNSDAEQICEPFRARGACSLSGQPSEIQDRSCMHSEAIGGPHAQVMPCASRGIPPGALADTQQLQPLLPIGRYPCVCTAGVYNRPGLHTATGTCRCTAESTAEPPQLTLPALPAACPRAPCPRAPWPPPLPPHHHHSVPTSSLYFVPTKDCCKCRGQLYSAGSFIHEMQGVLTAVGAVPAAAAASKGQMQRECRGQVQPRAVLEPPGENCVRPAMANKQLKTVRVWRRGVRLQLGARGKESESGKLIRPANETKACRENETGGRVAARHHGRSATSRCVSHQGSRRDWRNRAGLARRRLALVRLESGTQHVELLAVQRHLFPAIARLHALAEDRGRG